MSDRKTEDLSPVSAMLCFYFDDPESMARYKACNEALDVLRAVGDFERWLRERLESSDDWNDCALANLVRDKLFECFNNNGVTVPGWGE